MMALAVNAPLEAHVVPLEKYGMPPLVPATVSAGVVVAVATLTMPPVKDTLVTVPEPAPVVKADQLPDMYPSNKLVFVLYLNAPLLPAR
jgi:hypothetical protein